MAATATRIDQVLSFGLEEEFLLADATTRIAVPRAPEVLDKAAVRLGDQAQEEFYATQVEFTTRPHMTVDALRADLVRTRRIGSVSAASADCLLVASASAVLTRHPHRISANPRYQVMAQRFEDVVREIRTESSGCHIHVGTLEWGEAMELGNHMRPWLPVLQALCVNAPFAAGTDRGCASWRHFESRRWPTAGPAPKLDVASYERLVTGMVDAGTAMDRKMVYWYARPSEHCPTLEIRVADVNPDLDVVMLYAVLVRGLATTLMAEIRAGAASPVVSQSVLYDAHTEAARTGLSASLLHPVRLVSAPAEECLDALVARSRPGLEAAGDTELAEGLLALFRAQGTGADRQRLVYGRRGSLTDVVDSLAVRMTTDD